MGLTHYSHNLLELGHIALTSTSADKSPALSRVGVNNWCTNATAWIPANQLGVSVRDPKKAADLESIGVRVRQGDFADVDSLRHAFEGATQLLIVSSNARATGGEACRKAWRASDKQGRLALKKTIALANKTVGT